MRELASELDWIETERDAFEAKVSPERRESPLFQGAMDTAVALMGAALSHHFANLTQDAERRDQCLQFVPALAKDWTSLATPIDADPRWWPYFQLVALYTRLVSYICKQAANDPAIESFLASALFVWGAFYSRIDVIPEEPS